MSLRWLLMGLLAVARPLWAEDIDGGWRFTLSGHNTYLYGEPDLGGGLRMRWEVVIEFDIRDGVFVAGNGRSHWIGPPQALSNPVGWFRCTQVEGSYLDSNLNLHETPHARFTAFPVVGEVQAQTVTLRPAYGIPGNYLAVTYECASEQAPGDNWFAVAERGKQTMGKRQDAERVGHDGVPRVRVREVVGLPPDASVELPLSDGWTFATGGDDDYSPVRYRLQRLP